MIGNRPPAINTSVVPLIQVDGAGVEPSAPKKDVDAALQAIIQRARDFSGIPENHMVLLQRIAVEHKSIIAIRPVERHNTTLILAGYPTKSLHIKGKSANWGPQYGFICVDQRFSKLRGRDPQKIHKANDSVQSCMEEGHAESIELHLPPARLSYLIHEGLLTKLGGGERFHLRAEPAQEGDPEFVAERQANGDLRILANNQPLHVLAPPLLEGAAQKGFIQRPLTADYDLLAVMPEWRQFSGHNIRRPSSPSLGEGLSPFMRATTFPDRRPRSLSDTSMIAGASLGMPPAEEADEDDEDGIPQLSLSPTSRTPSVTNLASLFEEQTLAASASRRNTLTVFPSRPELRRSNSISSLVERYEAPLSPRPSSAAGPVDNVSEHEKRIAESINAQLREDSNSSEKTGYESAWQLVHHGSDEGNPASDEADNYPATVFLPEKMGDFELVAVLKCPEDLARLVRTATAPDAGYHFEGNKHWPMARQESPVARRRSDIERRLSIGSNASMNSNFE